MPKKSAPAFRPFAISAVAKHFSATWEDRENPPDAYLTIDGRRIALDVARLCKRPGKNPAVKARLREDKVAQRVLRDIEQELHPHVPAGKTLFLTLGAPIKTGTKLVTALTKILLAYLKSGTAGSEVKKLLLGNRARFQVVDAGTAWKNKVIGFVFSGDPPPALLAKTMHALHSEIIAASKKRPATFSGDRWLALGDEQRIADIKTYRYACARLPRNHKFKKILMVLETGRVEVLSGS